MQIDVRLTVPNDLVVKASDLRTFDSPISLGALNVTLGGDLYVQQVPYDQLASTAPSTRSGAPTISRAGGSRFSATAPSASTASTSSIRSSTSGPSASSRAVTANVNVRGTLEAAGNRPEQHAAARAGRHPVAHRLQPADQSARRRASSCRWRSGAGAGDRRRRHAAGQFDRQRVEPRRVRDQHGPGQRRGRGADDRRSRWDRTCT